MVERVKLHYNYLWLNQRNFDEILVLQDRVLSPQVARFICFLSFGLHYLFLTNVSHEPTRLFLLALTLLFSVYPPSSSPSFFIINHLW